MPKMVVLLQRRADKEIVAAVGSSTSGVAWWRRTCINTAAGESGKAKESKEVSHNHHGS